MSNRVCNLLGLEDPVGLIKKKSKKTYRVFKTQQVVLLFACILMCSCQRNYVPKPNAYFRIDFPEREYRMYDSIYPFTFEYPVYGRLIPDIRPNSDPYWFDIKFPKYRGTIHLTYREIDNNFDQIIEENWRMLFSGIAQRADAINDKYIENHEAKTYSTIFEISGNAATHVLFYVTDSVKNFLRGSLYFTVRPNHDSLAPVVAFFREDIIHLIESVRWEEVKK